MQQASPDQQKTLLDAIGLLRSDLTTQINAVATDFRTFRDTMPDVYVPRREIEQNKAETRDRLGDQHARLTALEEWRLSETRRQADMTAALTAQINAAVTQSLRDSANDKIHAQEELHKQRTQLDGRTIAWYASVILILLSTVFSLLTTHPITVH